MLVHNFRLFGSHKIREFLDRMNNYPLLKEDSKFGELWENITLNSKETISSSKKVTVK